MNALFATASQGLEELLRHELEVLGAVSCKIVQGGVSFQATTEVMYNCLMWSRLASRILLPLREFDVYSDLDLYAGVNTLRWSDIFDLYSTFAITFTGKNQVIRDTRYGALKVKDAIVDSFNRQFKARPNIDKEKPDIRLSLYLRKNRVVLCLDLSGENLYQRGYRQKTGVAPLKENIACAMILRSGWLPETPLIDPMCGSGTLLIEAAMLASDKAPGLCRKRWGFTAWLKHDELIWQSVVKNAKERAEQGHLNYKGCFWGYDHDATLLDMAKQNAKQAGVDQWITFGKQDINQLTNPCFEMSGTLISNPPYGERMESEPALIALYTGLGKKVKRHFGNWQLSLLSSSESLLSCLQLRAERQFKVYNGPLLCVQKNYRISQKAMSEYPIKNHNVSVIASDFANRLTKNVKKYQYWAQKEGIDCYRIYDGDLPDYNVAIDRYDDYFVIQEYAPPKTIDPYKAHQRLMDAVNVTMDVLRIPASRVVLKVRQRQKGKQQYQKLAQKGQFLTVTEYDAKLLVNLTDYLDTGLFLDHRCIRKMIGQLVKGKDFLNLFAYTGSATVHAGLGGAKSTTTIDISKTYIEWATKNLSLNGLVGRKHRLLQADCLLYLKESRELFDLIFIDPPTFSNSKRMDMTFDVQRDHIVVMKYLKQLLRPEGVILFSNNKRNFELDNQGMQDLGLMAKNITAQTLSNDFSRNPKIHNSWLIKHEKK